MEYSRKQKQLDVKKWVDSETKGYDTCGSYDYCSSCDKDVKHPCVCNFFSQYNYGYDGRRYTSYDAFWNCLNELRRTIPIGSSIGFPARIGCDRGGANWAVIEKMIEEVLGADYFVYIVHFDGGK